MGCWNETCAVSNLFITAGQRVVVLGVVESVRQNPGYFESDAYKPIPILWEGVYDEYGGVRDQKGFGLNFFLQEIKEQLVEMELGSNQYHDIAISKHTLDESLIWEAHQEGRLQITQLTGYTGSRSIIHLLMIHGEVYDAIMKEHTNTHIYYTNRGEDNEKFCYRDYTIKEVLDTVPAYVKQISKIINSSSGSNLGYGYSAIINNSIDKAFDEETRETATPNLADIMFPRHFESKFALVRPVEKLIQIINDEASETAIVYVEEVLKFQWLNDYMNSIRKGFEPSAQRGSQQEDGDPYCLLAKAMIKIAGPRRQIYKIR